MSTALGLNVDGPQSLLGLRTIEDGRIIVDRALQMADDEWSIVMTSSLDPNALIARAEDKMIQAREQLRRLGYPGRLIILSTTSAQELVRRQIEEHSCFTA